MRCHDLFLQCVCVCVKERLKGRVSIELPFVCTADLLLLWLAGSWSSRRCAYPEIISLLSSNDDDVDDDDDDDDGCCKLIIDRFINRSLVREKDSFYSFLLFARSRLAHVAVSWSSRRCGYPESISLLSSDDDDDDDDNDDDEGGCDMW
jgi:hypothetical protein